MVPESARNIAGHPQLLSPIMDTRLTISEKSGRTNEEVVKLLLASLTSETGTKVVLGKPLEYSFKSAIFPEGATNIPARDLLEELSKRSGAHRLWLLLWDPTFHYYALNIF
jgi:hypothetical protein